MSISIPRSQVFVNYLSSRYVICSSTFIAGHKYRVKKKKKLRLQRVEGGGGGGGGG